MKFGTICKVLMTACIAMLVLFPASSCTSSKLAVNVGPDGIALKGYDPVAYFTMNMPVKGLDEYSYEWKGARWLFANSEHRDLFSAAPEKYAPQYGGY